ncbi:3-methyladenine DNA glycosylase [Chitinophagaceae bacterium IBVUCB1]|nr:3-methyladenine DNA glycosylase [Chitinophagaceae bacterium IBVUCB1]
MRIERNASYKNHLLNDKKLHSLLSAYPDLKLKKRKNICLYLCASIMSQQLSTKVADIIYARFLALYDTKEPKAQQIADTPFEKLRAIGLSNAKVSYVQNVANYALEHGMEDKKLYKMTDEEVMQFLLPIKGVGRWTVEMLLMFVLGREDVFAQDDLGIQQGMCKLYGIDATDKKAMKNKMLQISASWSPYRTFACMMIWRYKDDK